MNRHQKIFRLTGINWIKRIRSGGPSKSTVLSPEPIKSLPMRFRDNSNYNIQYLDVEQGMSSSFVYTVMADKRGNLWLGTYGGGVCRYDGKNIYVYMEDEGLSHNRVRAIMEDNEGNIWVGTNGGGVSMFNGYEWTYFTTRQGLANNIVNDIFQDSKGNIWLAGDKGALTVIIKGDDGFRLLKYQNAEIFGNRRMYCIREDRNGNIWIGSDGHGVVLFDGKSFANLSFLLEANQLKIRSIAQDSKGVVWLATNGGGVVGLELDDQGVILKKTINTSVGLDINEVLSLEVDSNDVIWIGDICRGSPQN